STWRRCLRSRSTSKRRRPEPPSDRLDDHLRAAERTTRTGWPRLARREPAWQTGPGARGRRRSAERASAHLVAHETSCGPRTSCLRADTGRRGGAVDHELHHELRPRRIEHYRGEARALLRAVRRGDVAAAARAGAVLGDRLGQRFVLADAL